MTENKQPQDYLIDQIASKFTYHKTIRSIFLLAIFGIAVLLVMACAGNVSPTAASLPAPSETPSSAATLSPTATVDPFEGLKVCRTWREAANCPIAENDFERLPDFVKANFEGFPEESMKVKQITFWSERDRTSFIFIGVLTTEEIISGRAVDVKEFSDDKGKGEYVFGGSLTPIGKPFFFNLKKDPPEINYDNLIAVFPVNNADGSVGTYTIIVPPGTGFGEGKSAEDWTEIFRTSKFEKMPYLPPVYEMGWIPISTYGDGDRESLANQGGLIDSVLQDTNDPGGERIKFFKEWEQTAIIPEELEKLPLFGSDMNLRGGFQR